MMFVVVSVVDLGQKGHDNINEAEHAGQGNIDIKVHISVEGDCPAKGNKNDQDN